LVRVILIPAKETTLAKQRLGSGFSSEQRQRLAHAMFLDVLRAARAAQHADQVAVVSSDRALLNLADQAGAMVLDERFPRGLNAAVKFATAHLAAAGASAVCTVLSDIPLTQPEDIDAMFEASAGDGSPCVVLVPSHERVGTNAILRQPPDVIKTRFGPNSMARHRDECRLAGVRERVLQLARPALDLDYPEDIVAFAQFASETHTLRELARLGLARS
jgi:2-phospho-L-lactate guanylyltransferase